MRKLAVIIVVLMLPLVACTSHRIQVEPIKVEPIHVTMDINLKVQRELEEFFDFEKRVEEPANGAAAPETRPNEGV